MTRIVLPYVPGMLTAETEAAVEALGMPVERHRLSVLDDEGYGRAVRGWWADGESFLIVEQDMVPTVAQVEGLVCCGAQWCCHPYLIAGKACTSGLGLTRFDRSLLAEIPTAADQAMKVGWRPQRPAKYFEVDQGLHRVLTIFGRVVDVHPGLVTHLHDYQLTPH